MLRYGIRITHIFRHAFHSRPRFIISLLVAFVTFFALLPVQSALMCLILSWNAFSWIYLLFLFERIINKKVKDIRKLTKIEDESARMVMFFLLAGCCVSLLVLFFALGGHGNLTGNDKAVQYILTASTLVSSWLLLPAGFTMHYAHLYYNNPQQDTPWLLFPDKPAEPGYSDFMYFSFTIAVASQTADVEIASSPMRRAVLMQSIVSFIFNMAILGLCINISAGLF
ncbi:DUF1345 domain-containing protein [Morganella morganii]|uniref:DUF1345 domain-containing protein n=1 Tax=Morganella morganii TaxID=582 RepID=A0A9Q4CUZ7_MORMO|nr:DUF1345 domain-containing protein [Morganella morganii]BEP20572.1 DUF1345 domain-containing protein [Morganella morganii subsp. sibonii]HAE77173.1 DUF1345 domain-containing protein [Morganella sp. (in: enterobacteria)]EGT3623596.1 DUF1345 domain-containing protein [Morganella morganii]EGT3629049.1 DUF1345 domain-containing protein [Morganella morganii]EGT3634890.1 DUF1345 domain-containing protein [Morganella morganii]